MCKFLLCIHLINAPFLEILHDFADFFFENVKKECDILDNE